MDIKEDDILGNSIDHHWYYRSKAAALLSLVGKYKNKTILDVGAGSGFFAKYLLNNTSAEKAICVDINYSNECNIQVAGKNVQFLKSCGPVDADIVLFMDVIEHVNNDVELLKEYADRVPDGSYFFISVPAFNFLWSGHDVFLGHRRRYTLKDINEVIKAAGFKPITLSYYFGFVFPIATVVRLVSRSLTGRNKPPKSELKIHNPIINSILMTLCYAEVPFFKFNKLAGLSVFCLCKKSVNPDQDKCNQSQAVRESHHVIGNVKDYVIKD